jgi:NADPH-dependent 2,4-dienoyl-CoA reductase/sulfur reductase-like enzyme
MRFDNKTKKWKIITATAAVAVVGGASFAGVAAAGSSSSGDPAAPITLTDASSISDLGSTSPMEKGNSTNSPAGASIDSPLQNNSVDRGPASVASVNSPDAPAAPVRASAPAPAPQQSPAPAPQPASVNSANSPASVASPVSVDSPDASVASVDSP